MELIKNPIPPDFESYLQRRIQTCIQNNPPDFQQDAVYFLSCLTYAKRPLLEDELLDAVCASRISRPGLNMNLGIRSFCNRVKDICAPPVRVERFVPVHELKRLDGTTRVERSATVLVVFRLFHDSVRDFLIKRPNVLQGVVGAEHPDSRDEEGQNDYVISEHLLARACLRYLRQAHYERPFACLMEIEERRFVASCPHRLSIDKQHFLAYAAKYWACHMNCPGLRTDESREEINALITSTSFWTTIQIQSLFTGGAFCIWVTIGAEYEGPHLVRSFPEFFTEDNGLGSALQKQYHEAIAEWGYFLDQRSCALGDFPGEIDLCLWGTLGEGHILHHMRRMTNRSKAFKTYKLDSHPRPLVGTSPTIYFHANLATHGSQTQLFIVRSGSRYGSLLQLSTWLRLLITQPSAARRSCNST